MLMRRPSMPPPLGRVIHTARRPGIPNLRRSLAEDELEWIRERDGLRSSAVQLQDLSVDGVATGGVIAGLVTGILAPAARRACCRSLSRSLPRRRPSR